MGTVSPTTKHCQYKQVYSHSRNEAWGLSAINRSEHNVNIAYNVYLDILSILDFEIAKYTNKNILECELKMP